MRGRALLLGAPLSMVTLLHHAGHMARVAHKRVARYRMPIGRDGKRVWVEVEEFDTAGGIVDWKGGNYFEAIARDYLTSGEGHSGKVGAAPSALFDAADLVEFAIGWMECTFGGQLPYRSHRMGANTMSRIVDLSLTLGPDVRGVSFEPRSTVTDRGCNTTTLRLYSHAGTHLDAPHHFIDGARTMEALDLRKCAGPARVIDLTFLKPRDLVTVEHLAPYADRIGPGTRLVLKTGWSAHADQPDYRTQFPRVSLPLARWLAERKIALLGVEPPAVADINDREELTAVHRALLGAEIVIVEGLANLDALTQEEVTFIALPLKLEGGDGSPVRAIAIEEDG